MLLDDPESSDFQIRVRHRRFLVHQAVLASRCPYFEALLGSGMCETAANVLVLDEVDPEAFETVVTWMYTDELKCSVFNADEAVQLLYTLDFLGMQSLMRRAEVSISKILESRNVLSLLDTAHCLGACSLRMQCLNYVLRNLDCVSLSRDLSESTWSFMKEHLPRRVFRNFFSKKLTDVTNVCLAKRASASPLLVIESPSLAAKSVKGDLLSPPQDRPEHKLPSVRRKHFRRSSRRLQTELLIGRQRGNPNLWVQGNAAKKARVARSSSITWKPLFK